MPTDQTRAMGRNFEDSLAYNEGRSWFFGIGINQYEHFSNLRNAVKDVEDMILVLQEKYDLEPDHIITLFDEKANRANIIRAFDRLHKEVGPEDKLLIYYSGHGHLIDTRKTKKGFWVPTDAEKDNTAHYIRNSTVREYLEDIDSLHTLLISDSCFSGSLFVRGASRSGTAIQELEQLKSRWAICSGRHDEEVYDGTPGKNSPFADSILDTLRTNPLPKLNVAKLADRVVELTRSNYRQLPEGNPLFGVGHKGGQYVFSLKADEEADWKACQKGGSLADYEAFLAKYPDGSHVEAAQKNLAELKEEKAWIEAKKVDTILSYYNYNNEYPQGKYQSDAVAAIKQLEEVAVWERALKESSISSFMEYKNRYPQGKFANEAQQGINELLDRNKFVKEEKKPSPPRQERPKPKEEKRPTKPPRQQRPKEKEVKTPKTVPLYQAPRPKVEKGTVFSQGTEPAKTATKAKGSPKTSVAVLLFVIASVISGYIYFIVASESSGGYLVYSNVLVGGIIGGGLMGLITGLVVRWSYRELEVAHIIFISIGWAVPYIGPFLGPLILGALMKLNYVSLKNRNVIIIVLGWFVGGVVAGLTNMLLFNWFGVNLEIKNENNIMSIPSYINNLVVIIQLFTGGIAAAIGGSIMYRQFRNINKVYS